MNLQDPENITLLFTLIGGLGTFCSLIWVKVIKPAVKLVQSQEDVNKTLEAIKKELTTNGGNSLKDTIVDLRHTINRIEKRQKVIEQRTKASLHYNDFALFETDHNGRLTWANNNFYEIVRIDNVDNFDWLNYVIEEQRQELFEELQSCLSMNRKLEKIVQTVDNTTVKLMGFPYRINDKEHGGFLISISLTKET